MPVVKLEVHLLLATLSVQNILQLREVGGHTAHLTRKLVVSTGFAKMALQQLLLPLPSPPFGRSLACLLHGQLRPRQ